MMTEAQGASNARRMIAAAALAASIFLAGSPVSLAQTAEERMTLATRPGVTELVLITPPAAAPVASVILFTGGSGVLFARDGAGQLHLNGENFLIRSRAKFAAAGFLVAAVDAPSDQPDGMAGFRGTQEHAQDIAVLIAYLRQRASVPVWLVGTSMGTISAANAAARLTRGGADGLVLTSSIVVQTRSAAPIQTVVAVDQITLPTLFVHNRDDACPLCAFAFVAPVMARFTGAAKKELIAVSGGTTPQSAPCEALSRHGYIGIEDEVVGDVARWIKGE